MNAAGRFPMGKNDPPEGRAIAEHTVRQILDGGRKPQLRHASSILQRAVGKARHRQALVKSGNGQRFFFLPRFRNAANQPSPSVRRCGKKEAAVVLSFPGQSDGGRRHGWPFISNRRIAAKVRQKLLRQQAGAQPGSGCVQMKIGIVKPSAVQDIAVGVADDGAGKRPVDLVEKCFYRFGGRVQDRQSVDRAEADAHFRAGFFCFFTVGFDLGGKVRRYPRFPQINGRRRIVAQGQRVPGPWIR